MSCTKASLHLSQNVNVTNDKQSYTFQEEVTMSCNNGFSGRTVTAGCTDVNTWSENTPTCTGKNVYCCLKRGIHYYWIIFDQYRF